MKAEQSYAHAMAALAMRWGATTIAVGLIIALVEAASLLAALVCISAGVGLIAAGFIFQQMHRVVILRLGPVTHSSGNLAQLATPEPQEAPPGKNIQTAFDRMNIRGAAGFIGELIDKLPHENSRAIAALTNGDDQVLVLLKPAVSKLSNAYLKQAAEVCKHIFRNIRSPSVPQQVLALNLYVRCTLNNQEGLDEDEVTLLLRYSGSLDVLKTMIDEYKQPKLIAKAMRLGEAIARVPAYYDEQINVLQLCGNLLSKRGQPILDGARLTGRLSEIDSSCKLRADIFSFIEANPARVPRWLQEFLSACQGFDNIVLQFGPKFGESMPVEIANWGYSTVLMGYEALLSNQSWRIQEQFIALRQKNWMKRRSAQLDLPQLLQILGGISENALKQSLELAASDSANPMQTLWERADNVTRCQLFAGHPRLPDGNTWPQLLGHNRDLAQAADSQGFWSRYQFPLVAGAHMLGHEHQGWSLLGMRYVTQRAQQLCGSDTAAAFTFVNEWLPGLAAMFMEVDIPRADSWLESHPFGLLNVIRAAYLCFHTLEADSVWNVQGLEQVLDQYALGGDELPTYVTYLVICMALSDLLSNAQPSLPKLEIILRVYQWPSAVGQTPREVLVTYLRDFTAACAQEQPRHHLWLGQLELLAHQALGSEVDGYVDAILQRVEYYLSDAAASLSVSANSPYREGI